MKKIIKYPPKKKVYGVAPNLEALPGVAFNLALVVQAFNPDAI